MKTHARRVLADSEYWIAMQRLWSFDEPQARWSRLLKNAPKLIGANKAIDPAIGIGTLISAFGKPLEITPGLPSLTPRVAESLNRLVSLHSAIADVERFQPHMLNLQNGGLQTPSDPQLLPLMWRNLLEQFCASRGYTAEQQRYLVFCTTISPDWLRLMDPGPWQNDARAIFYRNFIDSLAAQFLGTEGNGEGDETNETDQNLFLSFLQSSGLSHLQDLFDRKLSESRDGLPTSFLPNHIVIVEGATEQILLPCFAELLNLNWQLRPVALLAAGGAKQVYKRYGSLQSTVTLRIDCVLDGDVDDQALKIKSVLRPADRLHILKKPGIEECFERDQVLFFCNQYFSSSMQAAMESPVLPEDLQGHSNCECLERLWRKRTHASFDKIGFARTVAENLHLPGDIPEELRDIVGRISNS